MIRQTRETKETRIELALDIDGRQQIAIETGHGFFDHLLHQLAFHAGWDLTLKAEGDLEVDDHHLVEDVAIVIGTALQEVWRKRTGMQRYGMRVLPMDDALILCAVDLCGRPYFKHKLRLKREAVGGLACEMVPHFFHSMATAGQFNLHLRRITGHNHHHLIEASFKALAHALREALSIRGAETSTKGQL